MAECKKFKGGLPKDLCDADLEKINFWLAFDTIILFFQHKFIVYFFSNLHLQSIDIGLKTKI